MAITLIQTLTASGGSVAGFDFTSIPGTYTDLLIVASLRNTGNNDPWTYIKLNTSTANFTGRMLFTDSGGGASTSTIPYNNFLIHNNTTGTTANTFTSAQVYIPNYAGSTNKSISIESHNETNATFNYKQMAAMLWSNTAAITGFSVYPNADQFSQYSSVSLYGVLKGSSGGVTVS